MSRAHSESRFPHIIYGLVTAVARDIAHHRLYFFKGLRVLRDWREMELAKRRHRTPISGAQYERLHGDGSWSGPGLRFKSRDV